MPKRPNPSMYTGGFDVRTGRLLPDLTSALNKSAMDYEKIIANDKFLSLFNTPEDYQDFSNYQIGSVLEDKLGINPFDEYAPYKAKFRLDDEHKILEISEETDDPKTKAYKDIYNDLIRNKGAVASPAFWRKAIGNSMTNGYVSLFAGKDLVSKLGDFSVTQDGIRYDGHKLDLDADDLDLFNKYISRVTGEDEEKTFFDNVLEIGASLIVDMPLLLATSAISSGAVALGGRTIGQALNLSNKGFGKVISNLTHQAVNFNLLGMPQTINAIKDVGIGAGVDAILHNTWMGTVATATGAAGKTLFGNKHVPIIKELLKRRPALREELGGLGGSFGFGYISGKLEGQENIDALAQGLVFAGTHFTNPRAYRRVLAEQKNKNVVIKYGGKEYFVEEKGQLYKINKDYFNQDGRIVKLEGYKPIKSDPKKFTYYNETQSPEHLTFSQALERVRSRKNAEKLLKTWQQKLPKDYFETYKDDLKVIALSTAMGIEGIKYRKMFTDWKLPEDASLHNKMVEISEKHKISYTDVKEHILTNVVDYLKDREDFSTRLIQQLGLGEKAGKDIADAVSGAVKLLTESSHNRVDVRILEKALRDKKMQEGRMFEEGKKVEQRKEEIESSKQGIRDQLKENKLRGKNQRIKFFKEEIAASEPNSPRRVAAEEALKEELNKQEQLKEKKDAEKQELRKREDGTPKQTEGTKPSEFKKGERSTITQTDFENLRKLGFTEGEIQRIPKGEEKKIIQKEESPKTYFARTELSKKAEPKGEEFKEDLKVTPKEEPKVDPKLKLEEDAKKFKELNEKMKGVAQKLVDLNPLIDVGELVKVLEIGRTTAISKRLKKGSQKIIDEYQALRKESEKVEPPKLDTANPNKKFKVKDKTKAIPKEEKKAEEKPPIKLSKEREEEISIKRVNTLIKEANEHYTFERIEKVDKEFATKAKNAIKNYKDMKSLAKELDLPKQLNFLWELMDKTNIKVITSHSTANAKYNEKVKLDSYGRKHPLTDAQKTIQFNPSLWFSTSKAGITTRQNRQWVANKQTFTEALVHESIHNLLRTLEAQNPVEYNKLVTELKEIQKEIQTTWFSDIFNRNQLGATTERISNRLKARIDYLTNRKYYEEIATISLSEPMISKYLMSIPATTSKPTSQSMFSRLADWIKSLVKGIDKDISISKLDEITNLLNKYAESINTSIEQYSINLKNYKEGGRSYELDRSRGVNRVANENAMSAKYGRDFVEKYNEIDGIVQPERKGKKKSPPKIEEFSKIQAEMFAKDVKDAKASKLVDVTPKSFREAAKNNTIIKLHTNLKKYANLNVPPVFYAEMSDKFRDLVYKDGESIIRNIPLIINTILNKEAGWNSAHKFNRLMWGKESFNLGRIGNKEVTPEGQKFLDAVKAYELGRGSGRIEKELTWDEFASWAKLNSQQREVLDAYKEAQVEAVEQMKYMKTKYITEFDDNPAIGLRKGKVEELLGKKVKKGKLDRAVSELNKKAMTDKVLKEKIAKAVVDQSYRGWGETFYYNSVRPTNPKMYLVDIQKINSKGLVEDRINTYFENKKEVDQFLAEKKLEGYDVANADAYQIKNLIEQGTYTKKLNAHQLMELANAGHIPLTNEIIKKLMEATKIGVDLHSNQKEYVKGMKYTAKEFETQLDRFVREAVTGPTKGYHLTKINNNLLRWESKLTPKLKSGSKEGLLEKLEYDYGQKYLNQLKQSEHTVVDEIRGAAIGMQVGGVKPAFLFQQAMQIFQTTLANSIGEVKRLNIGTTGDAIKHFNSALGEAISYSFARMAEKSGRSISTPDGAGISPQSFKLLKQLEDMNKIGGTGIKELTAEIGTLEHKYSNTAGGSLGNAQRTLNFLGKGVEKWTRIQTALTYEKIGRAKGMEGKELLNFMATGIDKNLAEWGKGGRAPIFDSKNPTPGNNVVTNALKKSFLTYKTFAFYNYGMWRSLIQNKQYSALWAKAAIGLGMHGITKFPLFASLFLLADLFTEDDTDHLMWQAADWLNDKVPMAGSIAHEGLGSIVGFDLRNTFGESTPLITDLYAESWADTWDGKLVEITLGAPAGFSKDVINGLQASGEAIIDSIFDRGISLDEDKERRAGKILKGMSPIFLRNILRAFKLEEDGFEVRGKAMVMKDDITTWDVLSKMLSFPIAKQNKAYSDADFGIEAKYNKAKQVLKKGKTHRKEFTQHLIKQGISGADFAIIMSEEMKRVAKHMNEAREVIRKLERDVKIIQSKRKRQNSM